MTRIVGLAGKAGSGKDHVAGLLLELFPGGVRLASGDLLKQDIEDTLGGANLWPLHRKPYSSDIRRLLQWWGTEFRRSQQSDYWTRKLAEEIDHWKTTRRVPLIVVTDVRFDNEARLIRRHKGLVVEVYAPDQIRRARLGGEVPDHSSEHIDFKVDAEVSNPGETMASPELLDYLGIERRCIRCYGLTQHVFHDQGDPTGWTPPPETYLVRG